MGGFLKTLGTLGATAAGTAVGGPLAGAAIGAGTGFLGNTLSGGDLWQSLGSGVMGAGTGALGGMAGTPSKSPTGLEAIPWMGAAPITSGMGTSLLDILNQSRVNQSKYLR